MRWRGVHRRERQRAAAEGGKRVIPLQHYRHRQRAGRDTNRRPFPLHCREAAPGLEDLSSGRPVSELGDGKLTGTVEALSEMAGLCRFWASSIAAAGQRYDLTWAG